MGNRNLGVQTLVETRNYFRFPESPSLPEPLPLNPTYVETKAIVWLYAARAQDTADGEF